MYFRGWLLRCCCKTVAPDDVRRIMGVIGTTFDGTRFEGPSALKEAVVHVAIAAHPAPVVAQDDDDTWVVFPDKFSATSRLVAEAIKDQDPGVARHQYFDDILSDSTNQSNDLRLVQVCQKAGRCPKGAGPREV